MKKRRAPKKGGRKGKVGWSIGAARFAKISAVEGIALTGAMRTRAGEFIRKDMSADERRRSIIKAYRKA